MCGRITLNMSDVELADLFGVEHGLIVPPRYNIAPTQTIPVLNETAPRWAAYHFSDEC